MLAWAQEHLRSGTFPRDDHREMCCLIVTYLSGHLPEKYQMRRPGAASEARFMADALYILKIALLKSQLQLSGKEEENVKKLAVFIALFHAPYFLRAGLAAAAAADDLTYFREMLELSNLPEFRDTADAVVKSLARHTAYLESAAVVFSLFNEDLTKEQRQAMADKLSSTARQAQLPVGKPAAVNIRSVTCLTDLVTDRSWLLFNLLNVQNTEWLREPVEKWDDANDFRKMQKFVLNLAVVNDGAERGISLLQELIDRTQDEDQLQALAQVVSWHRQTYGHTKEGYACL